MFCQFTCFGPHSSSNEEAKKVRMPIEMLVLCQKSSSFHHLEIAPGPQSPQQHLVQLGDLFGTGRRSNLSI